MIRPLTCLSLVAALGAGLYLYQEKHRAQLLDRDITHTVKQAEQARDRIGLLKAEWALLNEPDRLAALAAQHSQLQALQPAQFVRLEDLRSRLPPVSLVPPTIDPPSVASAAPVQPPRMLVAAVQPGPLAMPASAPAVMPVLAPVVAPVPVSPPVQLAAAHSTARANPLHTKLAARPHETETAARAPERIAEPTPRAFETERHPLFAPVMPAYAPTRVVVHAPTVQTASVMASEPTFVGSALGMARAVLAAPVPVASATTLGSASGR